MTVGLSMIVKNESEMLSRVLDGVTGAVDEIVIVDTGSTDGTRDVARKYTDKVYSFDWIYDFAAARNFALSKMTTDYWMWLDADDIVPPKTARAISKLMREADGSVDVYMLPYIISTDDDGKPTFEYYRERIIKNSPDFKWSGRVHEAVAPRGKTERVRFPVIHAKPHGRVSGTRNLDIYRQAVASGEKLSPRERYYYARELYFNGFTDEAASEFSAFLDMRDAFYVNKIDACVMLSRCHRKNGNTEAALEAAFRSFAYGLPTGEACCEIGSLFFERGDHVGAAYWYERALRSKPDLRSGAFIDGECYGFIPLVWLTVCYDRLGEKRKAYKYHLRAKKLKSTHPSVVANDGYFKALGFE